MGGFAAIGQLLSWAGDHVTTGPVPLAARLVLAALFFIAGVNKLRHPLLTAAAAANFGVVKHATKRVGYLLGLTELLTATFVVFVWSIALTFIACLGAIALSVGFAIVTTRSLQRGDRFPCGCLTASEDEKISPATVLRAVAMAGAATIALLGLINQPSPPVAEYPSAAGLAICSVGLPLAMSLACQVWRTHRRFMRETNWAWVLWGPARRADVIADR